jgi:23S rRNA pseudouridine2605 synthase
MRLNKYIASCGVASRRAADAIVAEGRVTVNGRPVDTIGMDVDPDTDKVAVDGALLSLERKNVYIMLNKPAGVLSTCHDDRGRRTVLDLVGKAEQRLFPVGRLDYDTEGLLLLTNDGAFAYRCTHPKHELDKTYMAVVHGRLDEGAIRHLQNGILLEGVKTAPAKIKILERTESGYRVHITIHEGKNRQVKRMFEAVGCHVMQLKRIAFGKLTLGDLPTGKWRFITNVELESIERHV